MKNLLVVLSLLAGGSTFGLEGFPDGAFQGEGLYRISTGETGSYKVGLGIGGDLLVSAYAYDQEKRVIGIQLKKDTFGFLKVLQNGKEIGTGYCLEKATVCHYEMAVDGTGIEETIVSRDGKIFRLGSKAVGTTKVFWQEALEPAN